MLCISFRQKSTMSILKTPRVNVLDILCFSRLANMCKANSLKTLNSTNVSTEKKRCKQGDNMLDPKYINTSHVKIVDQKIPIPLQNQGSPSSDHYPNVSSYSAPQPAHSTLAPHPITMMVIIHHACSRRLTMISA